MEEGWGRGAGGEYGMTTIGKGADSLQDGDFVISSASQPPFPP